MPQYTPSASSRRFLVLLAVTPLLLAATLVGCGIRRPTSVGGEGRLSLPADGNARVLSQPVGPQTPDKLVWKWSVLGGRSWGDVRAKDTTLTLADGRPLNEVDNRGKGTNIWECDLVAERLRDAPDKVRWSVTLHGINRRTVTTDGTVPLAGDLAATVRVLEDRDSDRRLPSELSLARIGDQDLRLVIEK